MKKLLFLGSGIVVSACLAVFLIWLGAQTSDRPGPDPRVQRILDEATRPTLVRFTSEAELKGFLGDLAAARRQVLRDRNRGSLFDFAEPEAEQVSAEAPPAPAAGAEDESITNTQEAGVDEGGIVKAWRDLLIVLRRGRLFTVRLSDGALTPVAAVDAFPPGKQHDAWYDEMLVADGTVVVVGFSYELGGTELGLFALGEDGSLRHRGTYLLRSNDYYSSRNYASRLIGNTLIFYMPYYPLQVTWGEEPDVETSLPGLRAFGDEDWHEIIEATEVYRPVQRTEELALHTVVTCDLAAPRLACRARGILGPAGRTFYVSRSAVYVWVTQPWREQPEARQEVDETPAVLYRLPLTGGEPGALRVRGVPTDQLSFKEDASGHLNVLVRAEGGGDAMWSPEVRAGDVALLRVPVAALDGRVGTAPAVSYTHLPRPEHGYTFQNRFVGDHVLYGTGSSWYAASEEERDDRIFVFPYAGGGEPAQIPLPHGVDRIEAMGSDAVVVGSDGESLHFSAVRLSGRPSLAGAYVQEGASQGETRTHGFFFKPSGPSAGVLGLPVRRGGSGGWDQLFSGSAEVLFLKVDDLTFTSLGALASREQEGFDDRCVASCADWYGNARPIFYRGRIFGLLGYELVEGRLQGGGDADAGALAEPQIDETRRVHLLRDIRR